MTATHSTQVNPLLSLQHPIRFDAIEAEQAEQAIEQLLAESEQERRAIEGASQRGYRETFVAFDQLGASLAEALGVISHLCSVSRLDALQEVYERMRPKVSALFASLPLSEPLYRALREAAADEAPDAPGRRYQAQVLRSFRRHGAELPAEAKTRLKELEQRLAERTIRFSRNLVESTDAFELIVTDGARLAGLPESAKEIARREAQERGLEGWRLTLKGPSYLAAMTYLEDRALREELYRASYRRASAPPHDNSSLIEEILSLRQEKAALLGYDNVADLHLEERMAGSGRAALRFIKELEARTSAPFQAERAQLEAFAKEQLAWEEEIAPWDVSWLAEQLRRKSCGFDEERLRPWLSLDAALEGLFTLTRRLFGLEVRPAGGDWPTWHPTVRCFELWEGAAQLGAFYLDLFPREGKQGGAWMNPLLNQRGADPAIGLICCNFSPPIDGVSLLTHRELETLFHEFGHLLHHLLSEVSLSSQAGTNVAWDFVELPSQILENWCWEREALDLFARHQESGELIPDELFKELTAARRFRQGSAQMRQLSFALTDLKLHCEYTPSQHGSALAYARTLMTPMSPAPLPEDYAFLCGFGHLFSDPVGYAAAYYSYKWAEVLDADAFGRFRREGIFNRETGEAFRAAILSRGDSEDPSLLFEQFMGRPPEREALFERVGL